MKMDYKGSLLQQVAEYPELPTLERLTQSDLAELARRRGIDFATAVLYDRVLKSSRWLGSHSGARTMETPATAEGATWAVMPGAFYRERKDTGADGAALRLYAEQHGIRYQTVPIESFGSVDRNAEILGNWLREHRDEPVVLISLSKGSFEVRRLLEHPDAGALFEPVRAWITLSGLLAGSPLVSWLRRRPWRLVGVRGLLWWQGYDYDVVRQLDRTPELVTRPIHLPPGLLAVQVVGFPLQQHLSSPLMQRGHRRLAVHGPNDGAGIILADVVTWPGAIYPVWGADHYLRTEQVDLPSLVEQVLGFLSNNGASPRPTVAASQSLEAGT